MRAVADRPQQLGTAAMVAGAAALVKSTNLALTADQVMSALHLTARPSVKLNALVTASPHEQGAGMVDVSLAVKAGLATANNRWCEVDFLTFESKAAKNIHVLGDSIQIAPGMPKSGHMANQHAKTCAAAVVALLQGKEPLQLPIYANTCYSFVTDEDVVHVASVHRYDAEKKTMLTVPGSGGVSAAASELEGRYALAWAKNIWADTLV